MFLLNNKLYDFVKRLVQVILPAASALYFGLASIWDLPAADKVVGTIAVITTFLGVSLGISHTAYKSSGAAFDGDMSVTTTEEGNKLFSLELKGDPAELEKQDAIRLNVKSNIEPVDDGLG